MLKEILQKLGFHPDKPLTTEQVGQVVKAAQDQDMEAVAEDGSD